MQATLGMDKTIFTFYDESGSISTLTLDKFVADSLQLIVGDVHAWIQKQYNDILANEVRYKKYIKSSWGANGELTRRAIGDIIRATAINAIGSFDL